MVNTEVVKAFGPTFLKQKAVLDSLFYYSKNANSEYIDCNERVAHALNLASLNDIKGRSDRDFGWSESRIQFLRAHDIEVMQKNIVVHQLEEPFTSSDGTIRQLISYKAPLTDGSKIIGVAGISIDIYALMSSQKSINQLPNSILYEKLSTREIECVRYYLSGKTAKETAHLLGISHRTVEDYFINIKEKLGYRHKRDLLTIFRDS